MDLSSCAEVFETCFLGSGHSEEEQVKISQGLSYFLKNYLSSVSLNNDPTTPHNAKRFVQLILCAQAIDCRDLQDYINLQQRAIYMLRGYFDRFFSSFLNNEEFNKNLAAIRVALNNIEQALAIFKNAKVVGALSFEELDRAYQGRYSSSRSSPVFVSSDILRITEEYTERHPGLAIDYCWLGQVLCGINGAIPDFFHTSTPQQLLAMAGTIETQLKFVKDQRLRDARRGSTGEIEGVGLILIRGDEEVFIGAVKNGLIFVDDFMSGPAIFNLGGPYYIPLSNIFCFVGASGRVEFLNAFFMWYERRFNDKEACGLLLEGQTKFSEVLVRDLIQAIIDSNRPKAFMWLLSSPFSLPPKVKIDCSESSAVYPFFEGYYEIAGACGNLWWSSVTESGLAHCAHRFFGFNENKKQIVCSLTAMRHVSQEMFELFVYNLLINTEFISYERECRFMVQQLLQIPEFRDVENPESLLIMGRCFAEGRKVPPNKKFAKNLLEKAAQIFDEQGNLDRAGECRGILTSLSSSNRKKHMRK